MTTTFVTLKILKMSVRYSQFSYIEFLASIQRAAVLLTIVITYPWLKLHQSSLKQALGKRIFNHGNFSVSQQNLAFQLVWTARPIPSSTMRSTPRAASQRSCDTRESDKEIHCRLHNLSTTTPFDMFQIPCHDP